MKTITFPIHKGGTGKTSTSCSIAVELANSGKKTIIIDADPQGNATDWFDIQNIRYELADILMKKCEVTDAILPTKIENLFIIPTASVGGNLRTYSKTLANSSPNAFKHLVRKLVDFEYCIIDTSPSFTGLEESCLLAADEAIPVLRLEDFSKEGFKTFIDNIKDMQERHDCEEDDLLMNKLILNARDLRVIQQTEYFNFFSSLPNYQTFVIPIDQAFPKAQKVHYPVQSLDITKKQTLEVLTKIANVIMER